MKINLQAVWEGIISLLTGGVLAGLVVTGRYLSLVVPRMKLFICLAAVIFILWGIASLIQAKRPVYRLAYAHCLALLIPVLLLFSPLLLGAAYSADSRTASQTIEQQNIDPRPFGIDFDTVKGDGIDVAHKKIMVTTANYYPLILKLTQHIKDYEGYEVYMIGFVSYDDKSLTNNNFTLARYLMACCINDVSPFGLICNYSGDIHWKEYQWLAVKGQLGYREYHGLIQPTIAVKEVVPAKRVAGYIYPY